MSKLSPQKLTKTRGQKIGKDVEDRNNTIEQLCLIDVYRTFNSTAAEYSIFSLNKTDYYLDHKQDLLT